MRYLIVGILFGLVGYLYGGLEQQLDVSSLLEEASNENVCLLPDNLDFIRQRIIDDTENKLTMNLHPSRGLNIHTLSDVYNTQIDFTNIREPLYDEMTGDLKCRVTINVNYMGNEYTKHDLVHNVRYWLRNEHSDGYMPDFFRSLSTLSSYTIDTVNYSSDNSFTEEGSYYISEVYNSDGTKSIAYSDDFTLSRDILAAFVSVDVVKQIVGRGYG